MQAKDLDRGRPGVQPYYLEDHARKNKDKSGMGHRSEETAKWVR
jgi:hypothetical protein